MAKQRISDKKLRRCSTATGKEYRAGFVRGGWEHFWAECWFGLNTDGTSSDADMVNYKTGESYPTIRDGKFIPKPMTEEEKARKVVADSIIPLLNQRYKNV